MTWLSMAQLDLENKRVLIREDLNVPLEQGKIRNNERIERALPTLKKALQAGAKVMVMSHLGRPEEGHSDPAFSLKPVAEKLSECLNQEVLLCSDWLDGVDVAAGQCVLCENVRFNPGEKANDPKLAKRMAALCDIFVMDAFATAHRAQASTVGVAQYAPIACAGPLLEQELSALGQALKNPKRPLVAIVGGAKVSSKIQLLESLLEKVDRLIVGGGIANTFLAAQGYPVGASLYEEDWLARAQKILQVADEKKVDLPLPVDVMVAKEFSAKAKATLKSVVDVAADDLILDVGPEALKQYQALLDGAGTIVWNGPLGVFEFPNFAFGTHQIAQAIAHGPAFSIAGGGDTLAAIAQFQVQDQLSYISTGGGAFLNFLEGESLPAVSILEQRAEQ